jgi:XTP/dITP diphosphohydrolase
MTYKHHERRSSTPPLRFITGNAFKADEAVSILGKAGITVVPVKVKLNELQLEDADSLVRHKVLAAFRKVGRPLLVEHTGLYIDCLKGLPGGLTETFWNRLQAEGVCELVARAPHRGVTAKTHLGYTDGRSLQIFTGEVRGIIAEEPAGNRDFQWDCIFIPDGHTKTFSELGDLKNELSMRKHALDKLVNFLSR